MSSEQVQDFICVAVAACCCIKQKFCSPCMTPLCTEPWHVFFLSVLCLSPRCAHVCIVYAPYTYSMHACTHANTYTHMQTQPICMCKFACMHGVHARTQTSTTATTTELYCQPQSMPFYIHRACWDSQTNASHQANSRMYEAPLRRLV